MKIKSIIAVLICSLLSFSLTAPSIACPPPDCGDCYTWNSETEECEWDCSSGQTCCSGTCCDSDDCCNDEICCTGDSDKCCTDADSGAYCCGTNETCCEGVCCSANQCCYYGKCYDSLGSCDADFADTPYCHKDRGCGCDPIASGCGDKKAIKPGTAYHFCLGPGDGKCINLGMVLCRSERNCTETGYHPLEICFTLNPAFPEGYCTYAPWFYCQDCEETGYWIPEYVDDIRCCFLP